MSRLQPAFIAKQKQRIKKPVVRLNRKMIEKECEIWGKVYFMGMSYMWDVVAFKPHLKFSLKK